MKNKSKEGSPEAATNNSSQATGTSLERGAAPPLRYILIAPLTCFLLGILLLHYTDTHWQLSTGSIGEDLFYGTILSIVTYSIAVFVTRLPFAYSLRDTCRELLSILGNSSIPQIILISLAAGVGEEFLFRGFLQEWLIGKFSIEIGITIAAICFGLLHFASVSYFVLTTLLGAAMGMTYYLSGSLLLVITWHACYDFLAIWVLSKKPSLLGIANSSEPNVL